MIEVAIYNRRQHEQISSKSGLLFRSLNQTMLTTNMLMLAANMLIGQNGGCASLMYAYVSYLKLGQVSRIKQDYHTTLGLCLSTLAFKTRTLNGTKLSERRLLYLCITVWDKLPTNMACFFYTYFCFAMFLVFLAMRTAEPRTRGRGPYSKYRVFQKKLETVWSPITLSFLGLKNSVLLQITDKCSKIIRVKFQLHSFVR